MSIINDALKKVQKNMEKNQNDSEPLKNPTSLPNTVSHPGAPSPQQPQRPPVAKNPTTPAPPPKPQEHAQKKTTSPGKKKKMPVAILVVILLCVAGFAAFYYSDIFTSLSDNENPQEISPSRSFQTSGDIEIKGIMMMNEKKMALIGDNIYEVGDTVNGMEIISISIDSVQLMDQGVVHKYKVNTNR